MILSEKSATFRDHALDVDAFRSYVDAISTMTPLTARRAGPLRGRIRVPGDKSISHRALILGALAVGTTRISGLLEGEDVLNTAKAMHSLGASVERIGEGAWRVDGVGVAGFGEPKGPLDFGNSGTGCRLVMGAVAGCPISAIFDGDASLRRRPMRRILEPVGLMGARVTQAADGGRSPVPVIRCRSSTARRCPRRRSSRRCCSPVSRRPEPPR
jgi:3-phosphoshikimate 1-carboxyvinyltransferase